MDFQNRAGSKPGAPGVASAQQQAIDRRERLRKLAMETIDLSKEFSCNCELLLILIRIPTL